ncbi:MAG: hypothetical protein V4548_11520 [Bacteroidota bacterium]
MKNLFFLLLLNTICCAQDINGIYQSHYNSFNNPNEKSNNFFKQESNTVVIEIHEFPNTTGSVIFMFKDKNGDAFSLKFQITGSKKTEKTDSGTYFIYPSNLYLEGNLTKTKCSIAIHSNLDDVIILYDDVGSSHLFDLKKRKI